MYRRAQNQTFYKYLLDILGACTSTTQRAFVESWIKRECKDELTMHRYNRRYTGRGECLLLRRTQRSLDKAAPVFRSIAIKPLPPEPGGPHPKSNVTMNGSWSAASHRGAAALQISMILPPLSPLSAVCFWDPRFAHDSNICRKNVTDGVGHLRYSSPGKRMNRCRAWHGVRVRHRWNQRRPESL